MKSRLQLFYIYVFLIASIATFAQQVKVPEEVYKCDGCTENVFRYKGGLTALKSQCKKFNVSEKYKDDIKCLLACKKLPPLNRYYIANRIAGYFMYYDGNRDSVIKYMEIAFEASPHNFCKTNYMFDDWIQNDPSFKDFAPMYIRMLSDDIWEEKIKQCKECCPETLTIEAKNNKKEVPINKEYYTALLIIAQNDQKHRNGSHDSTFTNIQPRLDKENRDMLDSLYKIYGLPYKDEVTSKGISACWLVLMHSTDCDWNRKWIDRYLAVYENGETKSVSVAVPIDRLFQYGEDSLYGYEKAFCDDANIFLAKMRKKYGIELAKKLGYD